MKKFTERERKAMYAEAIEKWGGPAQCRMAQEECGELIVAINQWDRQRIVAEEVIDEVADVTIMAGQLRELFRTKDFDPVGDRVESKLKRLRAILDGAEKTYARFIAVGMQVLMPDNETWCTVAKVETYEGLVFVDYVEGGCSKRRPDERILVREVPSA